MMNLSKLRETIAIRLEEWATSMPEPDRPIVGLAGTQMALSPRDIADEVRQGTRFGNRLLDRWVEMAIAREAEASLEEMSRP